MLSAIAIFMQGKATHMAMVADYRFTGPAGGTAVSDSSAGGHDGNGVSGAQLDGGGGMGFDGSDDYALIPADPAFDLSEGTVIIEFVQDTASTGNNPWGTNAAQTLFSVDAHGTDIPGHLTIYVRADGMVGVRHQDGNNSYTISGGHVEPGEPVSIGYSWGPDGSVLVVNGVEIGYSSMAFTLPGGDIPIVIGASQANMTPPFDPAELEGHFDGTINHVQIHDTAMHRSAPVPCFAAGTMIATPQGEVPVECLRPGDLVLTADQGAQPVIRVEHHRYGAADLAARPLLCPVRIAAGALGNRRALTVSRQHAMLLPGTDVLVRAVHLARWGDGRFRMALGHRRIDYHHLSLHGHQIVYAEGAGAETLLPARSGPDGAAAPRTARPILDAGAARRLLLDGAGGTRADPCPAAAPPLDKRAAWA